MSESDLDNLVKSIDLDHPSEEPENGVQETPQELAPVEKVEQTKPPVATVQVGGATRRRAFLFYFS